MEFLAEYGLFLAKTATLVVAIVVVAAVVFGLSSRSGGRRSDRGHIEVRSLNDALDDLNYALKQVVFDSAMLKHEQKQDKKKQKQEAKDQKNAVKRGDGDRKPRVFVLDFDGDIQASAVKGLRQEVTAVLSLAEGNDEVVVRLESPGGAVHGYGLAASQLRRIVDKEITLTVAVDKVAASGGYMMACIANRIIAAPFALLGSIGVVAQLPNFHRFLKNKDVDYEIFTAGEFKRTVTVFGENTEKGREKFVEELEDVHTLFKEFVHENRPVVDMARVATGEAWYGKRALELKLCDELQTSDEYLVNRCQDCDVYAVNYVEDKSRVEKVFDRFTETMNRFTRKDEFDSRRPYMF